MATSFNTTKDFDDSTSRFLASAGVDGIKITRTGTLSGDQQANTAWDYFSDTPSVSDAIEFKANKMWKDLTFNVGTAMNGSPVFIWEYLANTTWKTLRTFNGDALTKTGVQTVVFTPPDDWAGKTNQRPFYQMRVRLANVTGVTEGGAQQTDKVKAGDFAITLTGTGTLSDFASHAASNTYEILPASTPAMGLVVLEIPQKRMGTDEYIDVILSGTSAGVGDTIDLTGTDKNGNALTETIDVSGGNGTYTSSKRYQDISQIDCNGFADGSISANVQKQGYVLEQGQGFVIGCYIFIGDGVVTTNVTETESIINFLDGTTFGVDTVASLVWGQEDIGGNVNGTSYPVGIIINRPPSGNFFGSRHILSRGTLALFGSFISVPATQWDFCRIDGAFQARDAKLHSGNGNFSISAVSTVNGLQLDGFLAAYGFFDASSVITGLKINSDAYMSNHRGANATFRLTEAEIESLSFFNNLDPGRRFEFVNCSNIGSGNITNTKTNANAGDGIYIFFSLDLTVQDINGNAVESATVSIKDIDATEVFSGSTNGSGQISQQELLSEKGTWPVPGPGINWSTKTPHTITITKSGYRQNTMILTMDRKRDEIAVLVVSLPIVEGAITADIGQDTVTGDIVQDVITGNVTD